MGSPRVREETASMEKILIIACAFVAAAQATGEAVAEPTAAADADPWYSAYGHGYGYGLGHYGYGYGLGYRGYGYGHRYRGYRGYYGKRSADAEAEPTADADAWYS